MRINRILEVYGEVLNEKQKFFIEYFDFTSKQYKDYSEDFCILDFNVIIDLIIEELNEKNNVRNLKFFRKKLGDFLKEDIILREYCGDFIKKINEHILSDKSFTLELCKKLKKDYKDGKYAKLCYKRLMKLLKSDELLDDIKDEIKYLTKVLIIELAIYGYSPKKISELMIDIFDDYRIYENGIFSSKFPIPRNIDIKSNENKAEYMNNLTIDDRFDILNKCFEKKKEKIYYVVVLKGISGENVNIKINNVHIYNYKMFPKFDFEKDENNQPIIWGEESKEKFKKNEIHCSICIERIDADNSIEYVKKELNYAIDVMHIYHNVECIIEADFTDYLVFNKKRELYSQGGTMQENQEFYQDVKSLRYDDYTDLKNLYKLYKKYDKNIINNNGKVSKIIKNSSRYFRKGREARATEDKILNYWICIENLFKIEQEFPKSILDTNENDKKYNIISSLLPYFFARKNIPNLYWKNWQYFCSKVNTYSDGKFEIEISKELSKKCQFNYMQKINLFGFIDNIEELKSNLQNEVDIEKLEEIQNILNNNEIARKFLNDNEIKLKEMLLLIYRLRNMIVHNAQYNIIFLDYYAKQIEKIASEALRVIIFVYLDTSKDSMYELIMDMYIHNKIELQEELKTKNFYDLMKELK